MAHKKPALDKATEEKRLAIVAAIRAFDLAPLEEGTDAYTALEGSLLQHGCINPVVMHGDEVISGRARKAICEKHNIHYETLHVDDLDEADLVSLQNDLSFCGRHLDSATKKAYAKDLLVATTGKLSNRAIGSMACLDAKTVQVVRESLEESKEIPHTVTRYSRDGRSQDVSDKDERKGKPTNKDERKGKLTAKDAPAHEEKPAHDDDVKEINPHLLKVDSFDMPETRPDYVYEVSKDKGSIIRRKVEKQRGDKYYLSTGKSLLKEYGHPTWLGAHDSLIGALRMEVEDKDDEIEELTEEKEQLVAELKNVEAQILGAIKEKEKLAERINKVEELVPPKGAAAETEEDAA